MRTFTVINCEQRTDEWFAARAGRLTSSEAHAIYMQGRKKGEESVVKRDLRIRLALERLTGRSLDGDAYRSKDMERGVESEKDARLAYEAATGTLLETCGFCAHTSLMVGASLDAFVREDELEPPQDDEPPVIEGIVEFKCPKTATHLEYLRAYRAATNDVERIAVIPVEYLSQITHELFVTGAKWADFVSFDDRMLEGGQLLIIRVLRKDVDLAAHELAVRLFLSEVEKEMAGIQQLSGVVAA